MFVDDHDLGRISIVVPVEVPSAQQSRLRHTDISWRDIEVDRVDDSIRLAKVRRSIGKDIRVRRSKAQRRRVRDRCRRHSGKLQRSVYRPMLKRDGLVIAIAHHLQVE